MSVIIDGTNGVSGVSGSAGTPAFTDSVDAGMFFPAANTVAFSTADTERMRIDSSGNVLVTSAAGLGYGTGSGGTVTQATSKSTAVTLNKPTGKITTSNAALAANSPVFFSVNNSLLSANDTVTLSGDGTTAVNVGNYRIEVNFVGNGSFGIRLTNISGGSLSEAVPFNFNVIKGATS